MIVGPFYLLCNRSFASQSDQHLSSSNHAPKFTCEDYTTGPLKTSRPSTSTSRRFCRSSTSHDFSNLFQKETRQRTRLSEDGSLVEGGRMERRQKEQ